MKTMLSALAFLLGAPLAAHAAGPSVNLCDPASYTCVKVNSDGSINAGGQISGPTPAGSQAVNAPVQTGGVDSGNNIRAFLTDAGGREYVNVYSLPALPAGTATVGGTVNEFGTLASPTVVTGSTPLPTGESALGYSPSGQAPVVCTLTAAATCGTFTPIAGRVFHVELSGTASASCVLERQFDGTTWPAITTTAGGTTTVLYAWTYTGPALSEDVSEARVATLYRVDCGVSRGSFTSGSLVVGLYQ